MQRHAARAGNVHNDGERPSLKTRHGCVSSARRGMVGLFARAAIGPRVLFTDAACGMSAERHTLDGGLLQLSRAPVEFVLGGPLPVGTGLHGSIPAI